MSESPEKTKDVCDEEMEVFLQSDDDDSSDEWEPCNEGSELSSVDSVEEVMFLQGKDITLDMPGTDSESEEPSADEEDPAYSSGTASGRSTSRGETWTSGENRWCTVDEPDITPPKPTFHPSRTPGPQLNMTAAYSALQLFQLFFTNTVLQTIVCNTNQHGRAVHSSPSKPWVDITLQDMFSFLSVVLYMGFVKCLDLADYWRVDGIFNFTYIRSLISEEKWLRIFEALHLSSVEDDAVNKKNKRTPAFDELGKIKPLYEEMREACRRNYHPSQEISIDERKSVCRDFKLFVLADSSSGYTWDFSVHEEESDAPSDKKRCHDSVMNLMDTSLLGTGFKLFVYDFYTSPALLYDLLEKQMWACGKLRKHGQWCPKTKENALDPTSPRGSMRWFRTGSLLFVQWRDIGDIFLCSTIHTAHGNETVSKKVKDSTGCITIKEVPFPPAIKDFYRCMGGVEVSNELTESYKVLHKNQKWYKAFFYHFVEIAVVNAFLLHKDLCKVQGKAPMKQVAFRETLSEQLQQVGSQSSTPEPSKALHLPDFISGERAGGPLKCQKCHAETAVKCSLCGIPLCLELRRNCFKEWHDENNT